MRCLIVWNRRLRRWSIYEKRRRWHCWVLRAEFETYKQSVEYLARTANDDGPGR